jgi:site-specific DNA-methyltransferase (adenine-specific)
LWKGRRTVTTWRVDHGDCLDLLRAMPDASVDALIADPPFGSTNAHWDQWATGPEWWEEVWRVVKPGRAVCLFMCGKPIVRLLREAGDWFRYKVVWDRMGRPSGFMKANIMPMRRHEDIYVFTREGLPAYWPHKEKHDGPSYGTVHHKKRRPGVLYNDTIGSGTTTVDDGTRYPVDLIRSPAVNGTREHPTQKPVAVMERLVRWYSDKGAVILDPFCGSGSTGVACVENGRAFIGIERDEKYVEIARRRIAEAAARPMLEGIK